MIPGSLYIIYIPGYKTLGVSYDDGIVASLLAKNEFLNDCQVYSCNTVYFLSRVYIHVDSSCVNLSIKYVTYLKVTRHTNPRHTVRSLVFLKANLTLLQVSGLSGPPWRVGPYLAVRTFKLVPIENILIRSPCVPCMLLLRLWHIVRVSRMLARPKGISLYCAPLQC